MVHFNYVCRLFAPQHCQSTFSIHLRNDCLIRKIHRSWIFQHFRPMCTFVSVNFACIRLLISKSAIVSNVHIKGTFRQEQQTKMPAFILTQSFVSQTLFFPAQKFYSVQNQTFCQQNFFLHRLFQFRKLKCATFMSCFYLWQTKFYSLSIAIHWNQARIAELFMMMKLQLSSATVAHHIIFTHSPIICVRDNNRKKKFPTCNFVLFSTATTLCMYEMCLVWQTSGQKQTSNTHTAFFLWAAVEQKWIFDGRSILKCQLTDKFLHPHPGNSTPMHTLNANSESNKDVEVTLSEGTRTEQNFSKWLRSQNGIETLHCNEHLQNIFFTLRCMIRHEK